MNTRNLILSEALKLFISKGYEKTTIKDIQLMCGISKGAIYHYFESKEAIMDEVIISMISSQIISANEIINSTNLASVKLFNLIDNTIATKLIEIVPKVLPVDSIFKHRSMELSKSMTVEVLQSLIEEGVSTKEFSVVNTNLASSYIYVMLMELLSIINVENRSDLQNEFFKNISALLILKKTNRPLVDLEERFDC